MFIGLSYSEVWVTEEGGFVVVVEMKIILLWLEENKRWGCRAGGHWHYFRAVCLRGWREDGDPFNPPQLQGSLCGSRDWHLRPAFWWHSAAPILISWCFLDLSPPRSPENVHSPAYKEETVKVAASVCNLRASTVCNELTSQNVPTYPCLFWELWGKRSSHFLWLRWVALENGRPRVLKLFS